MQSKKQEDNQLLAAHFFRTEYGKMLAVVSRYVGIETAEDIVQETLLSAVEHWQHHGIPANPQAWLYLTAKNKSLNWLRKLKHEKDYRSQLPKQDLSSLEFDDQAILDEQLSVMLLCCAPAISEDTQIALMLKILCGFSIAELSAAFCTNSETINKRLVRGRKSLRKQGFNLNTEGIKNNLNALLKTIYLLFNEGYLPARKNQIIRKDLCLEAIRLTDIILANEKVTDKGQVQALMALMCFNCARFDARVGANNEFIEMENQDRNLWSQELIDKGLRHLDKVQHSGVISNYLILAAISANHCIASTYEKTNWEEILSLYDALLKLEDSTMVRLNKLVAYSKVNGPEKAILELMKLKDLSFGASHLYFSTLATLYQEVNDHANSIKNYKKAISLAPNARDKELLRKKMHVVVPVF
ncbi:hypothetical protein BKI52_03420 [marine bacterium AO1-C]|nr:hypothetical protein BKI52_03420 [marine bacterium AO1-C]